MNILREELLEFRKRLNDINKKNFSWSKVRKLYRESEKIIEELKKNQDTNPEIQQRITNLQKQKEEIKTSIDQKRSQQEKIQSDLQKQSSQKPFNWLYVVIPGGILLVVMGIVIAYLMGKKGNKE